MVTFRPDVGYAEALRKESWQKDMVSAVGWTLGGGMVAGMGLAASWAVRGVLARRR